MTLPAKPVLVPPRPNLGPEPLPERAPDVGSVLILGSGVAILAISAWWLWRRRRARAASFSSGIRLPTGHFDSSHAQTLAWSEAVREALVARYGPAWSARTTEEIAHDDRLAEELSRELLERLIGFLDESDRVKFAAPTRVDPPRPVAHFEWAAQFIRDSRVAAGARSMIKGK